MSFDQGSDRVRNIEVDGYLFVATCSDPYGFWKVSPLKGSSPKALDGYFTSYENVLNACALAVEQIKKSATKEAADTNKVRVKRDPAELRD